MREFRCCRCGEVKSREDFYWRKSGGQAGKRITACKPCHKRDSRDVKLRFLFGISAEDYEARLEKQEWRCAVCFSEDPAGKNWAVDHDHACCPGVRSCGKCVRGLLCNRCNVGLGMFRDNPGALRSAAGYLEGL